MKRLLSHLLEPRAMILGFTVFYFVWAYSMWNREPLWDYHREMFVGTLFLISAIGLAVNRLWSNLLTAILSGQLPFAFVAEFWMLSKNAEVTTFSPQHIETCVRAIAMTGFTPAFWLTLSIVLLSYSVVSIIRRPTARKTF
jgi:hypothetical protein